MRFKPFHRYDFQMVGILAFMFVTTETMFPEPVPKADVSVAK
jgi:hypothetical protein